MIPRSLFTIFLLIISPSIAAAAPAVSFAPTMLKSSGDSIVVSWTNVDSPSPLDWLGIYSPPDSPNHHFIGYFFLNSSSTWNSGAGNLSFPLINLRKPYQFRVFRWKESEIDPSKLDHDGNPLPRSKHLLARSGELRFENPSGPEHVHLAFTDRADEMRVSFVAGDGEKRYVKYGENEEGMLGMAETTVARYEREDMCDSPANDSVGWRDPGFIHHGVMTNLKKGVRYYYKVGSDSGAGVWSPTHSFVSRNEDSDETIAFLYGDMGTAIPYKTFIRSQDESTSTMKWILRDIEALGNKPAFISHIGDISYARGYSWIWDNFFNQIEPVASKLAYHVCIGNHEYDWPKQPWKPDWAWMYGKDGGGECGVPYSLRFKMPGNSSFSTGTRAPPTQNLYYSFDMGSVHFAYFSTETNFLQGSDQYNFLKHDLENVNRKKTPFVVVQGHRPMYTTSNEIRDVTMREHMLKHLEPLLVNNNVTLALWGHVHRYERFCPLNNFKCGELNDKQGGYPVHAVIGMAGQDWQPIWEPRPEHPDVPVFPQPERSLYRGGEFGYTRLVATKEKLTLSYVGNHDGEVHDMVEILATGEALSGGDSRDIGFSTTKSESSDNQAGLNSEEKRPIFSELIKGGSVLLLGAFMGYVAGFVSRSKTGASSSGNSWLPVKTSDES